MSEAELSWALDCRAHSHKREKDNHFLIKKQNSFLQLSFPGKGLFSLFLLPDPAPHTDTRWETGRVAVISIFSLLR